jgi:tetratricopeptide (TPR) repeat protein
MRKVFFSILMLMLIITIISNVHAQAPQETLAQYIADLQKNPNDNALREKIIRHVQTVSLAPTVPEEAERFIARGAAATKNAKDANDFKDAVKEFEKASLSAPWLASAYYNLGIARDKAGMYADAIKSLKLYLLASPNATDAKSVKNLIYEIEYKQEKAAKESSPAALAAQEQKKLAELLKKMDGRRYKAPPVGPYRYIVDVQGKMLVFGRLFQNDPEPYRFPNCSYIAIEGRVSTCSYHDNEWGFLECTQTISEDANRITRHIRYRGKVDEIIYFWP